MKTSVGKNIITLRKELGWTQTRLAKEAKVSGAALSKIESGKTNMPTHKILSKIAVALRTDNHEIINGVKLNEDKLQIRNKKFYAKFGIIDELNEKDQYVVLKLAERLKQ